MNKIKKSFKMSCKEQFAVTRQIYMKSTAAKIFYGFFIGVPLIFSLGLHLSGQGIDYKLTLGIPFWCLCVIMLGYVCIIQPYSQYLEVKRTFTNNASAQDVQNCTISASGLNNSGSGFNVSVSWDEIIKVEPSKDYLLFFISKRSAYFIPLAQLSIDEQQQIMKWSQ